MKQILSLLIITCAFSTSFATKYQCEVVNYTCELSELHLARDNYVIEPEAKNLTAITKFDLFDSTVEILSKEICKSLPNLQSFFVPTQFIEEIEDRAFEHCTKLENLVLSGNSIGNINRTTFKGLQNLKKLYLSRNDIPIFDVDLSDSKQLRVLSVVSANISTFVVDSLREQINLKELYLDSNNLFDVDIESILRFCPHLKIIHLLHNKFKCSRYIEILSILNEKRVESDLNSLVLNCVADEEWDRMTVVTTEKPLSLANQISVIQVQLENLEAKIETKVTEVQKSIEKIRQEMKEEHQLVQSIFQMFQNVTLDIESIKQKLSKLH